MSDKKKPLGELVQDIKSAADAMQAHLDEQKRNAEEQRRAAEAENVRKMHAFHKQLEVFVKDVVGPMLSSLKRAFPDMEINATRAKIELPTAVYEWRDPIRLVDATFTHPDPRRNSTSSRRCRFLLVETTFRYEVTLLADVANSPSANLKAVGTLDVEKLTGESFEDLLRIPLQEINAAIPRLSSP